MSGAFYGQHIGFCCGAAILFGATALQITLPATGQMLLLAGLVALLGLPHGALDPLVARKAHLWSTRKGLVFFLILYTALAVSVILLWVLMPAVGLSAFLAYSAWHFSGDWKEDIPKPLALLSGMTIISGPALFHGTATTGYFSVLANAETAGTLVQILSWIAVPAFVGQLLAAGYAWRTCRATSRELLILAVCVATLPPLLFFLLYFCGLHSPRHLISALSGLPPKSALWTAALFSGVTVVAGLVAMMFITDLSLHAQFVKVTFIGLAALTVPHMIVIDYAAKLRRA